MEVTVLIVIFWVVTPCRFTLTFWKHIQLSSSRLKCEESAELYKHGTRTYSNPWEGEMKWTLF
jgi:hypothetical protein